MARKDNQLLIERVTEGDYASGACSQSKRCNLREIVPFMNAAAYWLLAEHLFRRACKTLLRSGTDFEFNSFDNANHFFQAAITGQKDEYAQLDKNFVPEFANTVALWILQR